MLLTGFDIFLIVVGNILLAIITMAILKDKSLPVYMRYIVATFSITIILTSSLRLTDIILELIR